MSDNINENHIPIHSANVHVFILSTSLSPVPSVYRFLTKQPVCYPSSSSVFEPYTDSNPAASASVSETRIHRP